MTAPIDPLPSFTLPNKWTGHIVRTPSGTTVRALDARAFRDKNLRLSPVHAGHPLASLFSFDVDGIPTVFTDRAGYEQLKGKLQ